MINIFKERLAITLKFIIKEFLLPILIIVAIVGAVSWTAGKYAIIYTILNWAVVIFISFILLFATCVFVNWLFIEPYKSRKKENIDN